jgi:hypothetical protein
MGLIGVFFILGPLMYLFRYFKPIDSVRIRALATVTTFILFFTIWMFLNFYLADYLSFETDYGILELLIEIIKIVSVTFLVSRISSIFFFSVHMYNDPK